MSNLYRWEGNYKLPSGREVCLDVGYSWGDPDTGIGAGVEEVKAFDEEGNEITLTEKESDAIAADGVLAERIEDNAADKFADYMDSRR